MRAARDHGENDAPRASALLARLPDFLSSRIRFVAQGDVPRYAEGDRGRCGQLRIFPSFLICSQIMILE